MILFYAIYDKTTQKYLTDTDNNLVRCTTILDCLDYLEYILKITDFELYRFDLKVADK